MGKRQRTTFGHEMKKNEIGRRVQANASPFLICGKKVLDCGIRLL